MSSIKLSDEQRERLRTAGFGEKESPSGGNPGGGEGGEDLTNNTTKGGKRQAGFVLTRADKVITKSVSWYWKHVLINGAVNSVQGIAGIGKTFLLCAVVAAGSNGGEVQGVDGNMERLKEGRVLYFSGDDDPATTLKPRIAALNANLENIHFLTGGSLPIIGSNELSFAFTLNQPSLVIFDTLQHFLPPKTGMNNANEITNALQPLRELAEKFNTCIVTVQHINKLAASGNAGEFSVNYAIGSSAINGLFRSIWTLGRLKDDEGNLTYTRALSPSKANLVPGDPSSILFELNPDSGFQWKGVDDTITADQLYNPARRGGGRGRPSIKDSVVNSIISHLTLKDGAMESAQLQEIVINETGCSERTYKDATKDAGVEHKRVRKTWYTKFPDTENDAIN